AGYADGIDTRLANRGWVLVRGRRARVVGSVCMDMMMIDVTGMDVSPGDEVLIPGGGTVIQPQDRVIILSTRGNIARVEQSLIGKRRMF
ncbi:MAG: hypothetical protein HGB17_08980, partial [Syntrophobacteraceae bacterium]|nr:hypothetical protein [Syntrophobacteraceae bacterium]